MPFAGIHEQGMHGVCRKVRLHGYGSVKTLITLSLCMCECVCVHSHKSIHSAVHSIVLKGSLAPTCATVED